MWTQRSLRAARSEIPPNGSTVPVSVVPADAITRNGLSPAALSAFTCRSRPSTDMRRSLSISTHTTWSLRKPARRAALVAEW
jgi:hypothetical protein